MPSKIDIVNRALVRIGAEIITSFDDESNEAIVANELYNDVVADLMSRHRWTFLKGQIQLSRLSATPSARWDAAYQIPDGIENVIAVMVADRPISFDRQDDKIFCNASTAETVILEYTGTVDEDRWPGWFVTLVSYELASTFAIPIGDRADLAEWYEKKSLRHFGLAKQNDSQGHTTRMMPVGKFIATRRGRGGVF